MSIYACIDVGTDAKGYQSCIVCLQYCTLYVHGVILLNKTIYN